VGGRNNLVYRNEFRAHRLYENSNELQTQAIDLVRYMPTDYFNFAQAAAIRIEHPASVEEEFAVDVATILSGNVFTDNKNYQVMTFKDLRYRGSLMEYESHDHQSLLTM